MKVKRIALAAGAALIAACGGGDRSAADSAAGLDGGPGGPGGAAGAPVVLGPQDIATATLSQVGSAITLAGNLDPAQVVKVRAQVPGVVTGVRVDRGSAVRKGAVLATIEAQGIRSQAAGARAQVAAARAQLSVANQRLAAAKRLYEAGAMSAIDYKTAQANAEAAEAQVAAAEAAEAGASESAARATITAPITGVVSSRSVSGGEAVSPGSELFTIVDASELELAGRVSVQDAARVRVGQPVTFTLAAYPNRTFRGRVARIDPTADPGTRQVGVYVRLPNPGNRIVGGQYARGSIATGSTETSVVIPMSALTSRTGNSAVVFVLEGNRVARREITVGASDETTGLVAVAQGIRSGERVLVRPTPDIGDGTIVSVASDAASPAAATSDSAN